MSLDLSLIAFVRGASALGAVPAMHHRARVSLGQVTQFQGGEEDVSSAKAREG